MTFQESLPQNAVKLSYIIQYPWSVSASMFWYRYPNHKAKHIISEDVLCRKILNDGRMYSKRIIQKMPLQSVPTIITRFTGHSRKLVIEECIMDPKKQSIETFTYNVDNSTKLGVMNEYCHYTPMTNQPPANNSVISSLHATFINKAFWINSNWSLPIRKPMVSIMKKYYKHSSKESSLGFEHVIHQKLSEYLDSTSTLTTSMATASTSSFSSGIKHMTHKHLSIDDIKRRISNNFIFPRSSI